ncbi:MAG: putative sulfate/molybdate transporter [Candidatus Zixiibacteriota bacterium]
MRNMKFSALEFSGALGDMGTFLPLTVALALVTGMDIGAILIFAGLFNIVTGTLFGLPIPVQPMKAIAAVAIAEQLLPEQIAAAGLIVGAVVLLLGLTGLIEKIERLVPRSVIRGIQLGIGAKLALKGFEFIAGVPVFDLDSATTAATLGIAVLLLSHVRRFPAALALLGIGLALTFTMAPSGAIPVEPGFARFSLIFPDMASWKVGLFRGALPQAPLTLLNSVLAVCALSGDLFPGKKVSTRRMAVSVGAMNLLSCWFGAMPMCHGSGGLAGQHFFGARTGGSVVMLGAGKALVGALFGVTAMAVLGYFPHSILGVMLVFAGVELALPARDQRDRRAFSVMALTAVGILAIDTATGFLIGLAASLVLLRIKPEPSDCD